MAKLILIILFISINLNANPKTEKSGHILYRRLSRLYTKWDEGLYGSRNFYKWEIIRLLGDSYGKEIISDYDFVLVRPYQGGKKKFLCKFWYGEWLQLWGIVNNKNLVDVIKKNNNSLWWRSSILVAIKGKIRKFYLNRTPNGRCIIIHLDKLELIKFNNKQNSKIEKSIEK